MTTGTDQSDNLTIRRLHTLEEAEACARLMASSEPWLTLGRDEHQSFAMIQAPDREVYIAERDGRFAGFIIINMYGAFVGYIQTVAVTPEARGSGMGTALIGFAERRIFAEVPNVWMCVSSFNTRARALYERLGYEVIGELRDYIVTGHSEFLLRKTIGPLSGWRPASGSEEATEAPVR